MDNHQTKVPFVEESLLSSDEDENVLYSKEETLMKTMMKDVTTFSTTYKPTDDSLVTVPDRDLQARHAGHLIYQSLNPGSSVSRLLESGSLSHSWRVPENQAACCGIMSPVRRTFCLITLFDLILIFILWVIHAQTISDSFFTTFINEITHYTFKTSLFDTVMCAAWRFVPLLLAYALFRINNPWVVAVSTMGTCIFLLTKVFLYDFTKEKDIMCYLLLIISFILSWAETWFLDFKVLPREQKSRERGDARHWRANWFHRITLVVVLVLFILPQAYLYSLPNERSPLLGSSVENNHFPAGDEYYSPVNSPDDSDDEEGRHRGNLPYDPSRNISRSTGSLALSLGAQEQEYLKKSREVWEKVWVMYHTEGGWTLESGSSHSTPQQGMVHSRTFPGSSRKVYKLEGYINCSPQMLFTELVTRISHTPKWMSTVTEARILTFLDDSTTIVYNVAAEGAGGMVSSRDFVSLAHFDKRDGVIVSSGSGITHPLMPPNNKHVRGENGASGYIFKPVAGNPNKCFFVNIINPDLKGWIPQYIVDRALGGALLKTYNDIQKHVAKVRQRGTRR